MEQSANTTYKCVYCAAVFKDSKPEIVHSLACSNLNEITFKNLPLDLIVNLKYKDLVKSGENDLDFFVKTKLLEVDLIKLLSHDGFYSLVFLCKSKKSDEKLILKIYRLNNDVEVSKFHKELFFLGIIDHPNIIKLIDFGFTADGHPFLITTFGGDKTLSNAFCSKEKKENTKEESSHACKRIAQSLLSLLSALRYCHNTKGIAHGDIKASNVMIDSHSDHIQLIDWNSAANGEEDGRGSSTKIQEDLKNFAKLILRILFNFPQGNLTASIISSMLSELSNEIKLRDALKNLLSKNVDTNSIYNDICVALEEFALRNK